MIPKLKIAKVPERLGVFADLRSGAVWCRLSVSIVGVDCRYRSCRGVPSAPRSGDLIRIAVVRCHGHGRVARLCFLHLYLQIFNDLQSYGNPTNENQWKTMAPQAHHLDPFGSFQNWWKHGWNTRTSESMASHPPNYTSLFLSCTNLDTLCVNKCLHTHANAPFLRACVFPSAKEGCRQLASKSYGQHLKLFTWWPKVGMMFENHHHHQDHQDTLPYL